MAHSWQKIHSEFVRRIRERDWQPGELIPSESDLALELGCARVTVNRALRELADKGFLDRKRKAGTRVVLNPERKATFVIPVIRLEVEEKGARYGHRLLQREMQPAPADVLRCMAMAIGTELLFMRALHLADESPFVLEERWVNTAIVPDIMNLDLSRISANEWLVNNAPFSGGDLSLGACKADGAVARDLACAVEDALLETRRTTWSESGVITAVRLLHAPPYRLYTEL